MKLDLITNKAEITSKRNENDEFYTPIYAIEPLLKYLKPKSRIWCPFDMSESNFVKVFNENGHCVINTHIDNGEDFFTYNPPTNIDYVISNPPYSIKYEVFMRLFEINKPFAMLVGVVGLFESQKRFEMFKKNDFEIMYLNKRVSYFKDYNDVKPKLNPPFSSVYLTKDILPNKITFERIVKK
ncbi:MAG: sugar-phospahte nucleotidyltransferase [Candidatus Actinomarinaceae bacterium]